MALLDLAGPWEALHWLPDAGLHLVARERAPVTSDTEAALVPTATFSDLPHPDVLCVPGGGGQIEVMDDAATLDWVRRAGAQARWVASICTGSFILGAADLLRGYRATSHWASRHLLTAYGATVVGP